ncbi:unnamed protein product, partial [marine sediment metagenome]
MYKKKQTRTVRAMTECACRLYMEKARLIEPAKIA